MRLRPLQVFSCSSPSLCRTPSNHHHHHHRFIRRCSIEHLVFYIPLCRAMTTTTATAMPLTNQYNNNYNRNSRLVFGKDDALFGAIEQLQGSDAVPFGRLLDAGTGMHSLRWIATLGDHGMTGFTAVTADVGMHRKVQDEADLLGIGSNGRCNVVLGNWFAENYEKSIEKALAGQEESFDTILADYLIGAMDGFSPFRQDQMISKLCRYLRPGGNLYIVALEPIPDAVTPPDSPANIICRVRQVRDACILLAGHRCYREYPLEWMQRHIQMLEKEFGIQLVESKTFPILYRHEAIVKQINVARSKFSFFLSSTLAESMKDVLNELEQQSLEATNKSPTGKIRLGFDYLVHVKKSLR